MTSSSDPLAGIPSGAGLDASKLSQAEAGVKSLQHGGVDGAKKASTRNDAKLHKVAKQFEAVFVSEMLRLARPADKASGFSAGQSGGTWQVFMDQALGEAAVSNGGLGLTKQIEESLRRSQGQANHPAKGSAQ